MVTPSRGRRDRQRISRFPTAYDEVQRGQTRAGKDAIERNLPLITRDGELLKAVPRAGGTAVEP